MSDLGFIHRFVPADREDFPVLLLLHGTGGNEQDLIPLGQAIAPGAALLSVRGKVLENGMPRFFRRFAEGVFDLEDLEFRTGELSDFLEEAKREYHLDSAEMIAIGYSNGANIASSLMLTRPGVISGGVLLRAMPTFALKEPVELKGSRVLLSAGRRDPIVTVEQSLQLQGIFASSGADVSMHWHNGGHELGQDDITAAQKWVSSPV